MTHDDKMKQIREIFDSSLATMDAKGRDYSGTTDAMSNFKDFGWKGIVVRLGDKYHRIKNLTKSEAEVKDESIDDTLLDLIGYAALTLVMRKDECERKPIVKFETNHPTDNSWVEQEFLHRIENDL